MSLSSRSRYVSDASWRVTLSGMSFLRHLSHDMTPPPPPPFPGKRQWAGNWIRMIQREGEERRKEPSCPVKIPHLSSVGPDEAKSTRCGEREIGLAITIIRTMPALSLTGIFQIWPLFGAQTSNEASSHKPLRGAVVELI